MSNIVAVGSMAFDTIETPFGKAPKILGGSANYFSLSAIFFAPVSAVSVVGEDFPPGHLEDLRHRGIDISGIKKEKGKTFHWTGSYGYDLHEARTLDTHLNVFEKFEPDLPESYRNAPFVFLGNIAPQLQQKVLAQIVAPKLIAIDTMNFWIEGQRDALVEAISRCHVLIINEAELRQLTKEYNIVRAAGVVRAWGPKILVVKRGEYGAMLFENEDVFSLPALPLAEVKDPTGAGDSFAGGFMGYLASQSEFSLKAMPLRKAVAFGCAMASFTVQDFGFNRLLTLTREEIDAQFERFVKLTAFQKA
jgi:sugar/nucleoside kinase (ribokinase family)